MIIVFFFSVFAALSTVRLTYFNVRGRGEAIRLALEDNRIPYVNDIVEKPSWPAIKKSGIEDGSLSFGQLPRLITEDGTAIVQSNAILRRIGRDYDLYGPKRYLTDMIMEAVEDWRRIFSTLLYQDKLAKEKLEEYKEKLNSKFNEETGGVKGGILMQFELFYLREGSVFFGGASPSIADYALYSLIEMNMCFIDDFFANFHILDRWFRRMSERKFLKAYVSADNPWRARSSGAGVGDCGANKIEL